MTIEVVFRFDRELAKLLKKACPRDKVSIRQTVNFIEEIGMNSVSTATIATCKDLKEIIIKADNEYRIFYWQGGQTIYGLAYCKKSSPQEQNRAIARACARLQLLKDELRKERL